MMLPKDYLKRMQLQLGGDYQAYLAAMAQPARRSIRINTLKASVPTALSLLGELVPNGIVPEGFMVSGDFLAGKHPLHTAGLFYMQEASAQLPARLLNAQGGMAVLDLCAAPGGKSTQLAAAMAGDGVIVCNEPIAKRAQVLLSNIERMGITNAVVTCCSPKELAMRLPNAFDAILVDAPCAGEGMFRKEPQAVTAWSVEHVLSCAERQFEILSSAQAMLKSGGRLVYSTCSFSNEENEQVVDRFLKSYPCFELLSTHRLYPHNSKGEGQFAAVLIKNGSLAPTVFAQKREHTTKNGVRYILPSLPFALEGLRVIRAGLLVGEERKGIFYPSHALCMANGIQNRVELSYPDYLCYMHGEQLNLTAQKGWCALCYKGYPIGLGKAGADGIKNHLPKGLRV